jgi:ClpP class serine protease
VGIHQAVVKQTPHADLASVTRPLSQRERELLDAQSARFYERFLEIVAAGRKLPRERVHTLAQGRVWSGQDAHDLGLVDILGGFESAVSALQDLLGTAARDVSFEEPLVMRPAATGALPWQAQVALRDTWQAALGLDEHLQDLIALARHHGPVLAYAPMALATDF